MVETSSGEAGWGSRGWSRPSCCRTDRQTDRRSMTVHPVHTQLLSAHHHFLNSGQLDAVLLRSLRHVLRDAPPRHNLAQAVARTQVSGQRGQVAGMAHHQLHLRCTEAGGEDRLGCAPATGLLHSTPGHTHPQHQATRPHLG